MVAENPLADNLRPDIRDSRLSNESKMSGKIVVGHRNSYDSELVSRMSLD